MTLTDDDTDIIRLMMPIGQFGVDGCHLIDGGRAQYNVGLEITKGVAKVVVQELHGILELVC